MRLPFAILLLFAAARSGHADPPFTVLHGVELHLTTTTITTHIGFTTKTAHGFFMPHSVKGKQTIELPSLSVTGYISRSTMDPAIKISSSTKAEDIAKEFYRQQAVSFWLESSLVKLTIPQPLLVSQSQIYAYAIAPKFIARIEPYKGPFDGHTAYAQPYYVPAWQVELLQAGSPHYHCRAQYAEVPTIYWIS